MPIAARSLSVILFGAMLTLSGCYTMRGSEGGAQAKLAPGEGRRVNPADVALPPGYRIEAVATGLTFPTGVAFDKDGRPHVTEGGYSYGEAFTTPRLLRIEQNGQRTVVASGPTGEQGNGPWNGVLFYEGNFYIAEGGVTRGGRILRVAPGGEITPLVENLPSVGDHHTNGPCIGPDGYLYFAVGTATNSGVVGTDNAKFGWMNRFPQFHDIPARDVKLTGQNFTTENPLTPESGDKATTGAFVPFATQTQPGQVIAGKVPSTGGVFRIRLDDTPHRTEPGPATAPAETQESSGGRVELVAWGLRNPFGLAFNTRDQLYVTENSYDVRGSRPVWGTGDLLWQISLSQPLWYGWPDFHGQRPLTRSDWFRSPGSDDLKFLLAEHPNPPQTPAAYFGVHSSASGLDFSRSEGFGFTGEAFVAQFGDMAPAVGKVLAPVGFKVVRVDTTDGVIQDFASNRGNENGPASKLKRGGLERPVACRFDPSGTALYVVDFGVLTVDEQGKSQPKPGTGVLWRITRAVMR